MFSLQCRHLQLHHISLLTTLTPKSEAYFWQNCQKLPLSKALGEDGGQKVQKIYTRHKMCGKNS